MHCYSAGASLWACLSIIKGDGCGTFIYSPSFKTFIVAYANFKWL